MGICGGIKMKGEELEQATVIQWCNLQSCKYEELKWLFHCPNESKRSPKYGAKLKKLGMRAGVPDILLLAPKGKYIGLAIEMKYGKNKCTIEQVKWLDWLYKQGYMCKVCWSAEEAITVIKEYLGIK